MGKTTTYIIIMSGLMLLFYFAGLLQDCTADAMCTSTTANSALLNLLLKVESWQDMNIWTRIIIALEGIGALVGVIAIGYVTRDYRLAIKIPIAVWLANLFWDFIKIFIIVKSANVYLALLFFAPLMILYVVTIAEWGWGEDT